MKRSKLLIGLLVACMLSFGLIAAGPLAGLAQEADTPLTTDPGLAMETQATSYQLWVNGKQVTSANAKNVLGNGTVSYNAKTNTLTLKNANITKARVSSKNTSSGFVARFYYGINYELTKDLTINLVGKNKITMPSKNSPVSNYGIYTRGNLIIGGTGSLTVVSNKAQTYSAGITTDTGLTIQGKAKVSAKGVATKVTSNRVGELPQYGGYGVIAYRITMKGSSSLTAIGAKLGFYKPYSPSFSFASGYTPHVKAGSSAKAIKVNKNKPAKSVYTKYKYVKITKATKASLKPAKMSFTTAKGLPSAIKLAWNLPSKNCTHLQLQISKSSSFSSNATWDSTTLARPSSTQKVTGTTIDSLSANTTYYVRVRAINKVGSKTYYGAWSATKGIRTLSGAAAG